MEQKIVIKNLKDVPILSMSLQSTLWNPTGNWRYLRPAYVTLRAPCSKACPIEQDISFYLGHRQGTPKKREGMENPNLKTGQIEILADSLEDT